MFLRFSRSEFRCNFPYEPTTNPNLSLTRFWTQGMASDQNLDTKEFIEKFLIPKSILDHDTKVEGSASGPECPVLVFINSRSGGQLGGDLLVTYRTILHEKQVTDLGEDTPDRVLRRFFLNLERLKNQCSGIASDIEKKLKVIVAGGDGTAGWLLGVISDLKLSQPPPVATVPLGTGNNLPFAFGWGKKNPGTDRISVLSFLNQVLKANPMKIDSWHILMRMKAEQACGPIAPLELPHSLHAFHQVSTTDDFNLEGFDTFRGGFWNYFSMGMDAQVSYAFHSERKLHPEKFTNQLVNQKTYAKLGYSQGWFLPSHFNGALSISQFCKVKIMKRNEWITHDIHPSIRSIVCLNLPSFSGGLNPWGTPNINKIRDRNLTPPYVDDGLLEIVGFRNAWHGLILLAPNGHGTRIAQTNRIRFEFNKGAAENTYMRIDGEPWKQPLPKNDDDVMVEISNLGQVKVLATRNCKSKSCLDPSSPVVRYNDEKVSDNKDEIIGEQWRKFGAADTFRIPDGIDMSHVS